MSYRKIEVDGKTYEYVIGGGFTKIKGVGVFLNERIGRQHLYDTYEVTPATIKKLIQQHDSLGQW